MATDWNKIAKDAKNEVSAAAFDKLITRDLSALAFPPIDKEKIDGFIAKIKTETNYANRVAAFKAITAVLTADGLSLLKKAMLTLLLCLVVGAGALRAEDAPMLDFGSFFTKSRIGYSVNQHYERSTVLYSAFKRYNAKPGVELANLNFGYDTSSKHPVVALGLRMDNADRLLWSGEWAKKHIESSPLPVIEFGPYLAAWPRVESGKVHLDTWYGFILAMGIK